MCGYHLWSFKFYYETQALSKLFYYISSTFCIHSTKLWPSRYESLIYTTKRSRNVFQKAKSGFIVFVFIVRIWVNKYFKKGMFEDYYCYLYILVNHVSHSCCCSREEYEVFWLDDLYSSIELNLSNFLDACCTFLCHQVNFSNSEYILQFRKF